MKKILLLISLFGLFSCEGPSQRDCIEFEYGTVNIYNRLRIPIEVKLVWEGCIDTSKHWINTYETIVYDSVPAGIQLKRTIYRDTGEGYWQTFKITPCLEYTMEIQNTPW